MSATTGAARGAKPSSPADALRRLGGELRADAVIAPHVRDPGAEPVLGALAASGPRAAADPGEYSLLFEATYEGYLLHYGEPRLLDRRDPDLLLLAGDYLYALGLERLAALGDMEAVDELADLISLSAQLHVGRDRRPADGDAAALWLAAAVAVGAGAGAAHEAAKQRLREGEPAASTALAEVAAEIAAASGMGPALTRAGESIGFAIPLPPHRG